MSFFNFLSSSNNITGQGVPPPNVYDTFGDNLMMYIDTESPVSMTTQDALDTEIVSFLTSDSNAISVTSNATEKTIWNSHAVYTRGQSFLSFTSTQTLYSFLHTATESVIAFRIFPVYGVTGTYPIFNNNNNLVAQKGIKVMWDNGNITFTMTKGVSGQTVISAAGPGGCTAGAWHDVIIKDTGSAVTIYIDGVSGTTANNAFTRATGDAYNNMFMFRYSSSGTWAYDMIVKNPMFINRLTTTEEDDLIRSTFLPGSINFGDGGRANAYHRWGQSNQSGRGAWSGTPSYIDDPTGAMMFDITNNQPDMITNKWAPHQYGVNANDEGQTEVGPDIQFAVRMHAAAPGTIYIMKYAISGSSMKQSAEPTKDWNAASGTNDCAYRAFNLQSVYALKQLRYVLNKDVHIKGIDWNQGQSDTDQPNDYYFQDFTDMLLLYKSIVEANDFDVSECWIAVSSMDIYVDRPGMPNLVAQVNEVLDNAVSMGFAGGTQYSSVGYGLQGDGTHFNLTGNIQCGDDSADVFEPLL